MLIDLSDIDDLPIEFDEELELAVDQLDPDQVAGPINVRLHGRVAPVGDGYLVAGTARAEGPILCSRCLAPVPWNCDESFSVELRFPDGGDGDEVELGGAEMDVVFLDSDRLDFTEMAVEQVMLSLPMRALCRPDCAGLCPECGANRNLDIQCGCRPQTDPRWDALRALQEKPS